MRVAGNPALSRTCWLKSKLLRQSISKSFISEGIILAYRYVGASRPQVLSLNVVHAVWILLVLFLQVFHHHEFVDLRRSDVSAVLFRAVVIEVLESFELFCLDSGDCRARLEMHSSSAEHEVIVSKEDVAAGRVLVTSSTLEDGGV